MSALSSRNSVHYRGFHQDSWEVRSRLLNHRSYQRAVPRLFAHGRQREPVAACQCLQHQQPHVRSARGARPFRSRVPVCAATAKHGLLVRLGPEWTVWVRHEDHGRWVVGCRIYVLLDRRLIGLHIRQYQNMENVTLGRLI